MEKILSTVTVSNKNVRNNDVLQFIFDSKCTEKRLLHDILFDLKNIHF